MKILKSFIKILFIVAAVAFTASCKPSIPDEYIQPGDMEDLLYDYHIAMAMAEQGESSQYDERVVAYKKAVLKKHGYTEQQVEKSLQYYIRHTDQLHDIYDDLAERLDDEAKDLGANGTSISKDYTQNGDTTNVWRGAQALVLSPMAGYNSYSFSVKVDSAFHKGDRLSLEFNSNYIIQEGVRNATAVMTVVLSNDSVVSTTTSMSSMGRTTLMFNDFGNIGIKSISGYFIFPPENTLVPSSTIKIVCITNIRLLRMHPTTAQPSSTMPGQLPPGAPTPPQGAAMPPQGAPGRPAPAPSGPPSQAAPVQQPASQQVRPAPRMNPNAH